MSTRLAIALAVAIATLGCSSSKPTQPGPGRPWWCWGDGLCFRDEPICETRKAQIGTDSTCVAHATAYCFEHCQPDGGCWPNCLAGRESCEDQKDDGATCVAQPPPALPARFADSWTHPGFWCWDHVEADGTRMSNCTKYPRACDERRAQWGVDEPCVAHDRNVICFQYDHAERVETEATCYLRVEDCQRGRPEVMRKGPMVGFSGFTECAPWPYL